MATCSSCKKDFTPAYKCTHCNHDESPAVDKAVEPCADKCSATVFVQETLKGTGVPTIKATVGASTDDTGPDGFRRVDKLAPGPHTASISLAGLEDKYAFPVGHNGAPITKTIAVGKNDFYSFNVDPLTKLKVTVKRRHDSNGFQGGKLKLKATTVGNTPAKTDDTTPAGGDVTFEKLRQDTYEVLLDLDETQKKKWECDEPKVHHPLDMAKNPDEIVIWVKLIIHLKLKYTDPDATERFFPKNFPITVAFDGGGTKDLKVLDDAGYIKFDIPAGKTKFTLKFDSTKVRYLVHEKDKAIPDVVEDPTDADLRKLTDAGKQFFALPKTWSLVQSAWTPTGVVVPVDGQIVVPADGIGTSDAPATLNLKPKLQYVRFEFFDRKYCADKHANKRVGIPPVVLKAARDTSAAGVPQNPVAGTHDVISNWTVDKTDNDAACQCLPWVITKKLDGGDLPKLNKKLIFEFAQDDAFVHSAGDKAADRKIVVLADTDAKRKPTRDRNQYYDLPKVWKSACYFTRFSDPAKNKFFDELAATDDPDLEASYVKATKLAFSLDDIVLLSGASQDVKDKDETDTDQALSEHSRFTMLFLDPADKFKIKVHKPRATAAYWTDLGFQKEAATTTRRNAILEYPISPRAIVFCNGVYDIHDKRTAAADFTKKEILGARAAKLEDTTISGRRTVFDQDADVTSNYVHLKRRFALHYLHYGATDGTTVYGALLTIWTARFLPDAGKGGTDAMVKTYREEGMERAMKRWNEKDYTFEEDDDKKEVVVKHFCLFEAKDAACPPAVVTKRGGAHTCLVSVRDDSGGSSAAVDGLTMLMRKSGALDEGENWGSLPATLDTVAEYEGPNAKPKSAFAHELGHASIGLWDDYVTGKVDLNNTESSLWKYTNNNVPLDQDGQRYYGMPFEVDGAPIMKDNRSVRVRCYWGRAKWLNDMAPGTLVGLLSSKRFRIGYEPAGKAKLKFSKPVGAGYTSIYKPTVSARPYNLPNQGRCDLHLYHLGQDEFAQFMNGGPYNGVLVICLKISACFRIPAFHGNTDYKAGDIVTRSGTSYRCLQDHSSGVLSGLGSSMSTSKWAVATADDIDQQKVNHAANLNQVIKVRLQDRFKLQGNGNFATTYIRIFPQWEFRALATDAPTGGTHFRIEFVFGSKELTPTAQSIVAGTACKSLTLVRYMLGQVGDADFTKDDFAWMTTWMNTNAGGRFNVGNI